MTDWAGLLATAHHLGWPPDTFWRATYFEYLTALEAHMRSHMPKGPRALTAKEGASFMRGLAQRKANENAAA